jgi:hypothetical protein
LFRDLTLGIKTIFKDNRGKSRTYDLINLITRVTYVRSAVDITLDYVITFLF